MKPWAATLITALKDAMVFEDLKAANYKLHNKFERFDLPHTLEALKTLARFHASSIIFEENKRNERNDQYTINDDYERNLDRGGYHLASDWFSQCMTGALEAVKAFSKYNETDLELVETNWRSVWSNAMNLSDSSSKYRNVICHRDLWNNNIMFRYSKAEDGRLEPSDCQLVDFQAIRYQPPAGDVMLLLCCNLDPKDREENLDTFLSFYYKELKKILSAYNFEISNIIPKIEFMISAEEQRQWGLVVCACLIPQFWLNDDFITDTFTDNAQFDEILSKNKGQFIKKMMENNFDYKQKVMEIFEEIADRYCF